MTILAKEEEIIGTISSTNLFEIAVNLGSAKKKLRAKVGEDIITQKIW